MKLNKLSNPAPVKTRKRVGRGDGSGSGRTAGRGEKGQKSRSGSRIRPYFEGGQTTLFRRLPFVRGFKALRPTEYTIINLADIEKHFNNGDEVSPETLTAKKLINGVTGAGLKILGNGSISKKVSVKASAFSATASAKITAAGGSVETLA